MISFDEEYVTQYIENAIKDGFNSKEWKTLFGGKAMKFSEDNFGESTTFPLTYIAITDCVQTDGTYDSSQEQKYTTFWFEIEHYNQAVEKNGTTKKELGLKINKKMVEILQDALNPHITSNSRIESPDSTIYRRRIEGHCNIDNNKKIFYR